MKPRPIISLLLCLTTAFFLGSCGKKGPPFVPKKRPIALELKDITVSWVQDGVRFEGKVRGPGADKLRRPHGLKIMIEHAWYGPGQAPCKSCPIVFTNKEVVSGTLGKGRSFSCSLPLPKRRGVHFFQIRVVGDNGVLGPVSERLQLVVTD